MTSMRITPALRATLRAVAHAPLSARLDALTQTRAIKTDARVRYLGALRSGRQTPIPTKES